VPSLCFLSTCGAQISAVKRPESLDKGYGKHFSARGTCLCALVSDEYSKHSSDPSVDYTADCVCRKLVSVPREVSSEPIILYYGCNIADDVPGYSVKYIHSNK